jgi:hypothetical protein
MKISYLLSMSILGVYLCLPVTVFAEQGDSREFTKDRPERIETRMDEREEKKEVREETRDQKREEVKEQRMEKRCEVVGTLVDKRINIFEQNKGSHVENYNKLKTRLSEIATKLKDKGFDTTELVADLTTFDLMVKEYAAKYMSFIDTLKSSKEVVCGESEGAYKNKLEESKGMLKELKQMRENIREFYLNEIRVDIKALRNQAVENSTTEEN